MRCWTVTHHKAVFLSVACGGATMGLSFCLPAGVTTEHRFPGCMDTASYCLYDPLATGLYNRIMAAELFVLVLAVSCVSAMVMGSVLEIYGDGLQRLTQSDQLIAQVNEAIKKTKLHGRTLLRLWLLLVVRSLCQCKTLESAQCSHQAATKADASHECQHRQHPTALNEAQQRLVCE